MITSESAPESCPDAAHEPWLRFTSKDRFGLALSGGGIRSATFNLGLLQSLGAKGLLDRIDYLATVSGGGYVGGFWTALRQHGSRALADRARARVASTPQRRAEADPARSASDGPEPIEVRHLREFSRFLMPRAGLLSQDTWTAVVAVLGGALPALGATLSAFALVFVSWWLLQSALELGRTYPDLYGVPPVSLLFATFTWFVQVTTEGNFRRSGRGGLAAINEGWFLASSVLAALFSAGALQLTPLSVSPSFEPTLAWALAGLALLALRAPVSRFGSVGEALQRGQYLERAAARCFVPALIWAGLGAIWVASEMVAWQRVEHWAITGSTGGALTATGLFVWLRNWLSERPEPTRASAALQRLGKWLRPVLPELLANVAVLLIAAAIAVAIQMATPEQRLGIGAGALALLLLALIAFDPMRVGLHEFYRGRIARCFLGAAKPTRSRPSATIEQPGDDFTLGELDARRQAPLHLVCCAANNLSGDALAGLYRGARSCVISPFGVTLGSYTASLDDLRFSSALTASGAAFNSQMGAISMRLGPAAAVLMSALNLRLGLWLPHPLNPGNWFGRFPGLYFFLEALGQSSCDPPSAQVRQDAFDLLEGRTPAKFGVKRRIRVRSQNLHLSDGGHFENLALYELIRRHCRYVIVSDASADPDTAFDDLANAVRRVREDFGVEIDLDISPLRPNQAGYSSQHAVVGTIHYDGLGGTDKGTILYFKPALTGDEPPDVLQYRHRNAAFPHESTGDQFFDEAQWESYRRLGEHAGSVILRVAQPPEALDAARAERLVERLFLDATQQWHPTQRRNREVFLELTERCRQLEAELRDNAPAWLRAEFFPEVGAALGFEPPVEAGPERADEELRAVHLMLMVGQVMEEIWLAAELDLHWAHPVNEGWMSYLHRWASTPTFRRWWPVLRPIFDVHFRDFIKDRFGVALVDGRARRHEWGQVGARLELVPITSAPERAVAAEQRLRVLGPWPPGSHVLEYRLHFLAEGTLPLRSVQVGLLTYRRVPTESGYEACWGASELFVPPALMGAGIVARLLDAVVAYFAEEQGGRIERARVSLTEDGHGGPGPQSARDPSGRLRSVNLINFYKSRGFVYADELDGAGCDELVRRFGQSAPPIAPVPSSR